MIIEVNNLVKAPLSSNRIKKSILKFSNKLKQLRKLKEISVALVGDKEIKKLNKNYRKINRVTDVLSFEDINEIVICYPQAKRQAKEKKHSVKKEIEILLIHGLLHLAGYDHIKDKDAEVMEKLEKLLIKL